MIQTLTELNRKSPAVNEDYTVSQIRGNLHISLCLCWHIPVSLRSPTAMWASAESSPSSDVHEKCTYSTQACFWAFVFAGKKQVLMPNHQRILFEGYRRLLNWKARQDLFRYWGMRGKILFLRLRQPTWSVLLSRIWLQGLTSPTIIKIFEVDEKLSWLLLALRQVSLWCCLEMFWMD